jgi:plasmid stabilization system protein ParE
MHLKWKSKALGDLARLHEFLVGVNPQAAAKTVITITKTVKRLPENPRVGSRLEEFNPQEVRRIIAGRYEIRYLIESETIYIVRLWHTREDR